MLANSYPSFFAELLRLRPVLETQGVIQRHHSGYRLRYRFLDPDDGYTRHRSLTLPTDEVVEHVRSILTVWREQRQADEAAQEELKNARLKQKKVLSVERELVQAIVGARGGGERQ